LRAEIEALKVAVPVYRRNPASPEYLGAALIAGPAVTITYFFWIRRRLSIAPRHRVALDTPAVYDLRT
jgi:hypothetical protein